MASLVKELVEAGIHFGHRSTHWNPKMAPYIFGKRNKIHIIDVKETIKGLLLARKFITQSVASGQDVLFVGTKRQARHIVERNASEVGMHYVTERWLGGTLTNFKTIRERLKRLEELEQIESSGEIEKYSKKMESQLNREKAKILRNLGGIRDMNKMPGLMVVIDASHEHNAVKEAKKLGIPTVCLIDTDSDPDYADIPIPGNDDAMRAIEKVVVSLCAAVAEGKTARAQKQQEEALAKEKQQSENPAPKRGRKVRYRADAEPGGEASGESSDAVAATSPQTEQAADSAPDSAPVDQAPSEEIAKAFEAGQ